MRWFRRIRLGLAFAAYAATMGALGGCSSRAEAALKFGTAATTFGLDITSASITAKPLSFSCWIRLSGSQTSGAGVMTFYDGTNALFFSYASGGTTLELSTPASSVAMGTTTAANWYYIAGTVSGTTWTQYHSAAGGSNTLTTSNTTDSTTVTTYTTMWIGSFSTPAFKGDIACAKVWAGGTVLSAAQIANEEWTCSPREWTNLYGFYPLIAQGDGNIDYSGAGHTLTYAPTKATTDTGPPIAWR